MNNNNSSSWQDEYIKAIEEREDFEFEMALFWDEEDEFNKSRSLRIVTLYQSV